MLRALSHHLPPSRMGQHVSIGIAKEAVQPPGSRTYQLPDQPAPVVGQRPKGLAAGETVNLLISFLHPPIETPNQGRGGCSKRTVSPTARRAPRKKQVPSWPWITSAGFLKRPTICDESARIERTT